MQWFFNDLAVGQHLAVMCYSTFNACSWKLISFLWLWNWYFGIYEVTHHTENWPNSVRMCYNYARVQKNYVHLKSPVIWLKKCNIFKMPIIFPNYREVSDSSQSRLVSQIHTLTHQIQLFFLECQHQQCGLMDYSHFPGYARNNPTQKSLALAEIKHEQEKLLYLCDSIKLSVRKDTQKVPLIKLITLIGSTFSRVVELMLGVQIKTCVDNVNCVTAKTELSLSLNVMTGLALEGNNLCRLLVKYGAVDTLLHLTSNTDTKLDVRIASLRALGSICCVLEGIIR